MEFSKEMSFLLGCEVKICCDSGCKEMLQISMRNNVTGHLQKCDLADGVEEIRCSQGKVGDSQGIPRQFLFLSQYFETELPKMLEKKLKTSHWSPGIDVAQARGADSELIKKATSWRMEDVVHSTSVVEI